MTSVTSTLRLSWTLSSADLAATQAPWSTRSLVEALRRLARATCRAYEAFMQVRITVRGRQYTVRSDESEEDIAAVAAELDRRMEDVAGRARSMDEYTVAMLTALNLASDLHRLRRQVADRLEDMDRDAASVAALLESCLPVQEGSR